MGRRRTSILRTKPLPLPPAPAPKPKPKLAPKPPTPIIEEKKLLKNDNIKISIVEDDVIRFEQILTDLESLGYHNVKRHLDKIKENNLDDKYYSCICGSVFLKSDSKIKKHKTTNKHTNIINKSIDNMTWTDILNNNIYCINVNRYIDRFVYFKKEASRLGFKKIKRISAFDGNLFRHTEEALINSNIHSTKTYQHCYDKLRDLNLKQSVKYVDNWDQKPFVGGQLGCAVSHYETIKNAYDNDLKYVFIFEDDIVGHQHWEYAEELFNNTPSFELLYLNVDIQNENKFNNIFIYRCKNNKNVGIIKKSTFGCHSYILSRSGMKKYLDYVNEYGIFCIDIDLKDMCNNNLIKYYNWITLDRNNKENNHTTNFSLIGQVVNLPLSIHNHRKGEFFTNIEGWCCPEKTEDFFKWINLLNCKSGLEIGVFGGSSLIRAGMMFKANNGHLVGIDPYSFIDSNKYDKEDTANYNWWKELDYDKIYEGCFNSLVKYELTENVDLIKINSDEYVKNIPDKSLDFLHIDGNHTTEQSVLDVKNYLPKCKNGSIIFLDDIGWETVYKARDLLRKKCKMIKETIQPDKGNSWGIYLFN